MKHAVQSFTSNNSISSKLNTSAIREMTKRKKRRKDNESLIMLFPAKGKQNLRFICLNCESKTQKGAFTLTLQDLFITL